MTTTPAGQVEMRRGQVGQLLSQGHVGPGESLRALRGHGHGTEDLAEIGRASCRERVCLYV